MPNQWIHVKGRKMRRVDNRRDRKIPLIQTPYKGTMAERTFRKHLKKASDGKMFSYDTRRTYASWLIAAGIDYNRVQQYMGHLPRTMTDIYSRGKVDDFLIRDAVLVQEWLKRQKAGVEETLPELESNVLFSMS